MSRFDRAEEPDDFSRLRDDDRLASAALRVLDKRGALPAQDAIGAKMLLDAVTELPNGRESREVQRDGHFPGRTG